jgi:hypothetical protein
MGKEDGGALRARLVRFATKAATDATWVFAIVVAMSAISSASSIFYLNGIAGDMDDLLEKDIKGQTLVQRAYDTLIEIESEAKDLALASDEKERAAAADSLRSQLPALRSLVLRAAPTLNAKTYRTLIASSKADASAFASALQKSLGPQGSPPPDEAASRSIQAEVKSLSVGLKDDLVKINDVKRRSSSRQLRSVMIQLRVSLISTVAILVGSIIVRTFIYRGQKRAKARAEKSEAPAS